MLVFDKLCRYIANSMTKIETKRTFSMTNTNKPSDKRSRCSSFTSLRTRSKRRVKNYKENFVLNIAKLDNKNNTVNEDYCTANTNHWRPWSNSSLSLSSVTWYHGETIVMCDYQSNTGLPDTNESVVGSILVSVDKYGDVKHNITYTTGTRTCIGAIPYQPGKYCLDFSDPEQLRYTSINLLLADLIENEYLQRVSFDWLINNCPF